MKSDKQDATAFPRVGRRALRLGALQLPGSEAADVEVILVEIRRGTITSELDLELHLSFRHRLLADGARSTHAGSTPGTIRWAPGEPPGLECFACLFAWG